MNRGTDFFRPERPRVPQEHKDSLCFTATVAQDRQLFRRKQAPSFKLSSGNPRHSALQVPASYVKLHPPATATAPRMLQTTLVPGHPPSVKEDHLSQNGPPRVTSECVSGHVNCTWPHDIRAQPCKHRRLKDRSRTTSQVNQVLPRSPYPLASVHMSSSLTLFLDKTPFFT